MPADVCVSVGGVRGAGWVDAGFEVRLGPTSEPHPTASRSGPHPFGQLLRTLQQLIPIASWRRRRHLFQFQLNPPQRRWQQTPRTFRRQRHQRVLEVIAGNPADAGHLQRNLAELGQRERHFALSRTHRQRSDVPLGLGGNRLPASVLGHV